jgi:hypothetical protein
MLRTLQGTLVFTPVTPGIAPPVAPVRKQTAPDGGVQVMLARYRVDSSAIALPRF